MAGSRVECLVNVINQQNMKPTYLSDFFRFHVSVFLRNSPNPLVTVSCVFDEQIYINCNKFFNHNQNFLWFYLSRIRSRYFTHQKVAQLSQTLIPIVKEKFNISGRFVGLNRPTTNFDRENIIPVVVYVFVDVYPNDERLINDQEMVEESIQIPASNEAISSLKAYSLPRDCCICMERFHDELVEGGDVKVSTMACGHIFHYNCIATSLQTSHVCPLCSYAMPT